MKNIIDAEYRLVPADGPVHKILQGQRRRLCEAFVEFTGAAPDGSVLYVGRAPAAPHQADTWSAVALLPATQRVTTHTIDASGNAPRRPNLRPSVQDRPHDMHLPFADGQFDWTFCPEVIEHVGGFERQYALVKELARVSRRGAFITTSNRRHPLEFNTGLPLLHWLPQTWWRRALRWLGKGAWASEPALHLLDAKTLYNFAMLLPGKPAHDVGHKRVFGIKAHFFLMIEKGKAGERKAAA